MEICSSYRCAVSPQKCSVALVKAKCIPHCSVMRCKTGSQQALCHYSYTNEILSSYKCAVSPQKCTAVLVKANCIPHCSVVLCKTGSQQALCHYSYTNGDLLFTQMCSESAEMHCSTGQGNMHSPLFSGALQNRLTAGTVSLQFHQWRFALLTGVQ